MSPTQDKGTHSPTAPRLHSPQTWRSTVTRTPKIKAAILVSILLAACSAPGQSDLSTEWPRFRGPNGAGVLESGALPAVLSPAENLQWRVPLAAGNSSPVVSGDRVFVTAYEEAGRQLLTLSLDRETGRTVWERRVQGRHAGTPLRAPNTPASPSPATDGSNVYAFFQDYGLISYDPGGETRWELALGPFNNIYGMAASPIVLDDLIILLCDQSVGSFILAVGKDDGVVRWRTERPDFSNGYSTPAVRDSGDGREILAAGSFQLTAYEAKTGRTRWWFNGLAWQIKALPVLGDGLAFVNGWGSTETQPGQRPALAPLFSEALRERDSDGDGFLSLDEAPDERTKAWFAGIDRNRDDRLDESEWDFYRALTAGDGGLLAVRAGGRGDRTFDGLAWRYEKSVPEIPSLLLYRGILYSVNDGGVVTAFDPSDGAVLNRVRLRGAVDDYFASPVAGDGKIYFASQGGVVTVLQEGSDLKILSTNRIGEAIYATPALAEGRIYVRTAGALLAFRLTK